MKWVLSKIERTAACIIETIIYLRECFKTFSCYGIVEAALIIEGMRKCNVFKIKHIYFWWDGYSYICGSLLFCQQIIYATDRAEKNIFSKSCICFLQSICFFLFFSCRFLIALYNTVHEQNNWNCNRTFALE